MDSIRDDFQERLAEIESYLELLQAFQLQTQQGPPKVGETVVTAQQVSILYSSVYVQLYNLVEATANWCIGAVAQATSQKSQWKPQDLAPSLFKEWIRNRARMQDALNHDHQLDEIFKLCNFLCESRPIEHWDLDKGIGGNWDDDSIEKVASRIGITIRLSPAVKRKAKMHIRDDKNALRLIRERRNRLAHGQLSFEECSKGDTVQDLVDLKQRTAEYLTEIITSFADFVENYEFIVPERRPSAGGTP